MKIFITGETYKTVGEKMRLIDIQLQPKLNEEISNKNYGQGIFHWGYISICCPPELYNGGFFKEIKKYTKKRKEIDIRLRIAYEAMLKANEKEVYKLFCDSFLRSIDIAENELEIKDFDFRAFRKDLTDLFRKEGWI